MDILFMNLIIEFKWLQLLLMLFTDFDISMESRKRIETFYTFSF